MTPLGALLLGVLWMLVGRAWLQHRHPALHFETSVDWEMWRSTCYPSSPWFSGLLPAHQAQDPTGRIFTYKRWRGKRFGLHDTRLRTRKVEQ
jgi:hypothetical protein